MMAAQQYPLVLTRGGPAGPRPAQPQPQLPQRTCASTTHQRSTVWCLAFQNSTAVSTVRRNQHVVDSRVKATASADSEALSSLLGEEIGQTQQQQQQQQALPTKSATVSLLNAIVDTVAVTPYNWYCNALEKHPLTTKACTSLVGFMLGDAVAQHITHPAFVDTIRMARLGAYGLLIDGPVGSYWYDQLEARVFPDDPTCMKAVLLKTGLDQTVYATLMTAVYFSVIRCMEGHPDAVMATLHAKFLPTLAANWVIWPLAHIVNFRFVPSEQRLLYNNVVCIFWLTLVSLMTHTNVAQLFHLK